MPFPSLLRTVRLLAGALVALAVAGCAVHAEPLRQAAGPRWAVLGDRAVAPSTDALAAMTPRFGGGRPEVLDLTAPGAGLDAVIQTQLGGVLNGGVDAVVLAIGPADLDSAMPDGRFTDLVSALLLTLTGAGRAPVIVGTIPAADRAAGGDRLAAARRLRRLDQQNRAIRSAAAEYGVLLVDLEGAGATRRSTGGGMGATWQTAIDEALAKREGRSNGERAAPSWISGLDGAALTALQARVRGAAAAGLRLDVVAKLGDSITSSPNFLTPVSGASLGLADVPALAATWAYFNRAALSSDGATSFTRESQAAQVRWGAAEILEGQPSPLARELAALRPGVALVMFGTNDLTRVSVEDFEVAMDRLLRELEAAQVIPLLSTIPDRGDRTEFSRRVPDFNAAVRALASVYGVPLIDFGAALAFQPNAGLAPDGIHPSVCPDGPGVLTPFCVRYGYNLRNLLTLQALDVVRRQVLGAGEPRTNLTPDPSPAELERGALSSAGAR